MRFKVGDKIIFREKKSYDGFVASIQYSERRYICAFKRELKFPSSWGFRDVASMKEPEYASITQDLAS